MHATTDILHDPVHLLSAVANTNGKNKERYQYGIGIQCEAENRQDAHLPCNGDQRSDDHQHRAANTARVPVNSGSGDYDREAKEHQYQADAVD
ncbi:hypothetical protein D3C71_695130 [compost metagenome]